MIVRKSEREHDVFGQSVRFIHVRVGGPTFSLSWTYSVQLHFPSKLFQIFLGSATLWSFVVYFRFQVKKKQFFRNFVTIMLFGAVGTVISTTVITLGTLLPISFG